MRTRPVNLISAVVTLGVVALAWASHQPPDKQQLPQERSISLFNGEDLTGWETPSSHWVVEDGTLVLKGRHDGRGHPDSFVWTAETFGDFILDLDFKIPEGRANSGYCQLKRISWPAENRAQIERRKESVTYRPSEGAVSI